MRNPNLTIRIPELNCGRLSNENQFCYDMMERMADALLKANQAIVKLHEAYEFINSRHSKLCLTMARFRDSVNELVDKKVQARMRLYVSPLGSKKRAKRKIGKRDMWGKITRLNQSELVEIVLAKEKTEMTNQQIKEAIRKRFGQRIQTTNIGSILRNLEDKDIIVKVKCKRKPYTWKIANL